MTPNDFDWQYYLEINDDLTNAGLLTEQDAINHYLQYGKSENRIYKPLEPNKIHICEKIDEEYHKTLTNYLYKQKRRVGRKKDGGYVIADLSGYDCYISAGIGDDESFSKEFLELNKILNSYSFDATIKELPKNYPNEMVHYKKNISSINNNDLTNLNDLFESYTNIFLKMDIEGGELEWFDFVEEVNLCKIKQMVVEFHEMHNEKQSIIKIINKISKSHYLIHTHGNNHCGIKKKIPDVIELTFLRKTDFINEPKLNNQKLPSENDYPNNFTINDYDLNYEPFVFNK